MVWLSLHIFYWSPQNMLLAQGVYPIVKELKKTKKISGFFFIRYNENGPHIRLRLKVKENDFEEIKQFVLSSLNSYLDAYPSKNILDNIPENYFPNNSIQLIEYEPEFQRYGGIRGVKIAELLFELSSITVLDIIESDPQMSYDSIIGYAIKLHLILAYRFGLNINEMEVFLQKNFNQTFFFINRWQTHKSNNNISKSSFEQRFDKIFESKAAQLTAFVSALLALLKEPPKALGPSIKAWSSGVYKIKKMLDVASQGMRLDFPPKVVESAISDKNPLFYLMNSYIHMTNNRLGINTIDEPYISYLLLKSIKAVNEKTKID